MVNLMNKYVVGNVLSIDGFRVTIIMRQNTNMLSYFYNGKAYRGVNIGEYIGIIRGPYKIVGRVDREYLNDKLKNQADHTYSLDRFERNIEITIIGYFYNDKFNFGIKCLPMIFNEAILLDEDEILSIIANGLNRNNEDVFINIGKSVHQCIDVKLPINGFFNSHLGIFGNTGSGKSNTLAKIYTELFNHHDLDVTKKSKFVVLDFNGEYAGDNIFISDSKKIIRLSTRNQGADKIRVSTKNFWNKETLSILFSATEKTQQPFIQNMLNFYIDNHELTDKKLRTGIKQGFKNVFEGNNNRESLNILKKVCDILISVHEDIVLSEIPYYNCIWHSGSCTYYYSDSKGCNIYLNKDENILENISKFETFVDTKLHELHKLDVIDRLRIIVNLQLIYGLRYNHVQFEHISPLLARIESFKPLVERTIAINDNVETEALTIISFKECNQDAKKILPLLISKQLYNEHLEDSNIDGKIGKTCHLIIDEAHNILSEQSTREADSFKDYRLEVFEQIIKEGRKFGFYLTISSQRPYDISPTIVSQLHNYFIHRLVNDLDLKMLANTVSTLDLLSKQMIPNLAPGQCILTGTLFELPLILQVKQLEKEKSPNSDNADIINLWKKTKVTLPSDK